MHAEVPDAPRRHRLTVDEYYRMVDVGILRPRERVELIDGEILDMAPVAELHGGTVSQLCQLVHEAVGARAIQRVQSTVILGRHSAPEPDLALLYARHAIPDLWLIDVRGKHFVRYRDPGPEGYTRVDEPDLGAPVPIPGVDGASVVLAAIFID